MPEGSKDLIEAHVDLVARIDANDVVEAFNGNDESILRFIAQLIALSHSSDVRERLVEMLGAQMVDQTKWSDEDHV